MGVIYEILLFIGFLLYLPRAVWRGRLPHRGWTMRLGRYPDSVKQRLAGGGAVWIHAVSVGETIAAKPLARAINAAHPRIPLVLSTVTPAGFAVASTLVGEQGVAVFAPLDFRASVSRAFKTIRPRLLLLVESELWPNLIRLAAGAGIPVVVVNGRVSERAFRRSLKVRRWLAGTLEAVHRFLMQTELDAERITRMGAPASRVSVVGSLKWDASLASRPRAEELQALAGRLGLDEAHPVIVAGSTHRGEEGHVLATFEHLRASRTPARLILAPRHLERIGEVEALAKRRGIAAQRSSAIRSPDQPWEMAIVDTLGQLPAYYGLAAAVFVGGSLIPHGGQNPIEPCSLGKPVVFGPSMENFTEIVQQLLAHQACYQLRGPAELTRTLQGLLANPEEARVMGARAQALVERLSGTTQKTLQALEGLLTFPSFST